MSCVALSGHSHIGHFRVVDFRTFCGARALYTVGYACARDFVSPADRMSRKVASCAVYGGKALPTFGDVKAEALCRFGLTWHLDWI